MARFRLCLLLLLALVCFPFASLANSDHIPVRWQKEFSHGVDWYVRTSPGILIVRSGKSLIALEGEDGRELWSLPEVDGFKSSLWMPDDMFQREKNLMEIPGMGILLLNQVKLPGMQEPQLVALNLATGALLWVKEPLDGLAIVATLKGSTDVILATMKHTPTDRPKRIKFGQRYDMFGQRDELLLLNPRHYLLRRINSLTGEVKWSLEYPQKFVPNSASLQAFDKYLLFQVSNDFVGCIEALTGQRLWEKEMHTALLEEVPVPLVWSQGNAVFAQELPEAADSANSHTMWQVNGLGKINGLIEVEGSVILAGEKAVTAVDPKSGKELWQQQASGARTNLLYDRASDSVIFADKKAIHILDRKTGAARKVIPLPGAIHPTLLLRPSPDFIVAYSKQGYATFNLVTGEQAKTAGHLRNIFPPYRFADYWPLANPFQLQSVYGYSVSPEVRPRPGLDWAFLQNVTLLPTAYWKRLISSTALPEGFGEAYLTQDENGGIRFWTFDAHKSKMYEVVCADSQIDVSTPLGLSFSVKDTSLRAWELPKD